MPKYILKRIVGTIPTLIIVVTFVFFFVPPDSGRSGETRCRRAGNTG